MQDMMNEIIRKLGFDPLNITVEKLKELEETDDTPGPFTKLTYEEFDFLYPLLKQKYLPD